MKLKAIVDGAIRIEKVYGAIAVKSIAKTISMPMKITQLVHSKAGATLTISRKGVYITDKSFDEPDFGRKEAEKLEKAAAIGVRGMKIFKTLGLTIRDKSFKVVPVDDPRIDPIWDRCAELKIPGSDPCCRSGGFFCSSLRG